MARTNSEPPPLDLVKFVEKYMDYNKYMLGPDHGALRTVESLIADAVQADVDMQSNLSALQIGISRAKLGFQCLSAQVVLLLGIIAIRSFHAVSASARRFQEPLMS
eukprot:gnl/TRDRNA2_/TRDRNA2_131802_c1_seq5.p1 gnl/TRDRNA2_/TRDRNA2_131802_c1~~gnl/TRDRNA2_/TRDRNA2_131802_c1_seq5.p1  ORF type:complete len:106 (+),score=17.77 gnl/TRDRNA2_/TRDRNA2_131802_c1_seq5:647-964(+)